MRHVEPFRPRRRFPLPSAARNGWRLKRYAIMSDGRDFDEIVATAATDAAFARLPAAGDLSDPEGNNGVAFQIVHFAEQIAAVSPVFFWRWGSVLAKIDQMRAQWSDPSRFGDDALDVVGCVWEMQIVAFEIEAWRRTVLSAHAAPDERLSRYLAEHAPEI